MLWSTVTIVSLVVLLLLYLHQNEEKINKIKQVKNKTKHLYLSPQLRPKPEPGLELTDWYNDWLFNTKMYDYREW